MDQLGDDRVGGTPGQLRLGGRDDPVGEHRYRQRLQVVREDVVAAFERGDRSRRTQKMQGCPGRRAEPKVRRLAGGVAKLDGVLLDRVGDVYVASRGDQPAYGDRVGNRQQVVQRV